MNASVLNYADFLMILNRPNYHAQPRGCLLFSQKKSHTFLAKTRNIPSPTMNKVSLISEFSSVAKLEISKQISPLKPGFVPCMDF
jgi:hypothetical protein